MTDQFIGEIRMFAGNFAPTGWALCNGQLMPISQNTALFSLLGTMYGGDGKSTYALPNLQGNVPLNSGAGAGLSERFQGETGGASDVTLLQAETPAHSHTALGAASSGPTSPQNATWGTQAGRTPPPLYSSAAPNVNMNPLALGLSGGNLPHNNMQPYLVVTFIIALQGIFPPRQ
jgi:microcystin-dependent protein